MTLFNHHRKNEKLDKRVMLALKISFIINLILTICEISFGLVAKSVALVGDGLHNMGDTFSILLVIIVYIIGNKVANHKYSYGFKRAEVIGCFINLIFLSLSGIYLFYEGIKKILSPTAIDGTIVIYVAILASIINFCTAIILLKYSFNNKNIRLIFIHNFSDVLGSIGVILSGVFAIVFKWYFIDAIVAIGISIYLVIQVILHLPDILNILMNASPDDLDVNEIKSRLKQIDGIKDVHHMHLWYIEENEISFNCHITSDNLDILKEIKKILETEFKIYHSYVQIEKDECDLEEGIF